MKQQHDLSLKRRDLPARAHIVPWAVFLLISLPFLPHTWAYETPQIDVKWRYQEAATGEIRNLASELSFVTLSGSERVVSDPRMEKTMLLIDLANAIKSSLQEFERLCPNPTPPVHPIYRPIPAPLPCAQPTLAQKMELQVGALNARLQEHFALVADDKVMEAFDVARRLSSNLREGRRVFPFSDRDGHGLPPRFGAGRGGSLNVTHGGAQDYESFKKTVRDGLVPQSSFFPVEGFLAEFDMSLEAGPCHQLICMWPAYVLDGQRKKLYVQLGMNSSVTRESFRRRPLNLSVVLDISGSMSATDNTERSRLEWAKESLIRVVEGLSSEDSLSIVLFETDSAILWPTSRVTDKQIIIEKIKQLVPKGSTNLEKGLRDGYQLVSSNFQPHAENRVLLISDAGLNTGVTDESSLIKLVSDYAAEKIGLTAIGLGLNFNQQFIHHISMARGGNYIFVHSGQKILQLVKNFDLLVTPIAYDFKAETVIQGIAPRLVKTYGIPQRENEPVRPLLDIRTLFLSEGGGAIVLEYDL